MEAPSYAAARNVRGMPALGIWQCIGAAGRPSCSSRRASFSFCKSGIVTRSGQRVPLHRDCGRLSMLPPWLERAAIVTGLGPRSQLGGHRRSSKNFSAVTQRAGAHHDR
jgi:hypothetical protein